MPGDISNVRNIYIITGYTDMRKSIDGCVPLSMTRGRRSLPDIPDVIANPDYKALK